MVTFILILFYIGYGLNLVTLTAQILAAHREGKKVKSYVYFAIIITLLSSAGVTYLAIN